MVKSNEAILEIVQNAKPDLVLFINSYMGKEIFNPIDGPVQKDPGFIAVDNMLKSISQYTKFIIMNLPNFRYPTEVSPVYIRKKKLNEKIDFKILRTSIRKPSAPINRAYERMKAISCPKCIFWDYQDALCESNYCNPIDPDTGLPVMRDFDHVNILGLRRLKPVLDKLVRKAFNITCNDDF
ncbi:hypothetical protein FO519_010026 [Halicephalobus sp. NKZ332]|nr:hypothetical protein FO519_010026 [Halicephalobus sp. NKZ332]